MNKVQKIFGMMTILAAGTFYVFADEVTDTIQEALKNYNEGKYAEAAGSLDYAAQLVRQKKGSMLQKFLPNPMTGWTAEDAKSETMGAAMFGGMLSAERRFKKGETGSVNVKIVTDSPMLQSMMMVFQNPMLATSDGGKMAKVKDQKAIVKYRADDKTGEITLVVANRFLVQVEGDSVTEQEMLDYAGAVDFSGLNSMS